MKKGLLFLLAGVVLAMILIFVFIPETLHVSQIRTIKGNQHGLYRALIETQKWEKWFPKEQVHGVSEDAVQKTFIYNNISYQPAQKLFDGIEVLIRKGKHEDSSVISIEASRVDSAIIQWNCKIITGSTAFSKFRAYLYAREVEQDIAEILQHLQEFLENKSNVYDINIQQQRVKDTFLITVKSVFPVYPDVAAVYRMIDKITRYIKSQDAAVTNFPMMHVEMLDSNHYETMVALPVDRELPDQHPLIFKKMVAGNILVTEIKGGSGNIKRAFQKLEDYIEDYKKVSPALPFESLITNRLETPDTTAWVTRIYYPIY